LNSKSSCLSPPGTGIIDYATIPSAYLILKEKKLVTVMELLLYFSFKYVEFTVEGNQIISPWLQN
jgi:hypothetical protein